MENKSVSFEKALERLNEIVKLMEDGSLPLEESLVLFEEASGLISECNKMLDTAEQKIVMLKANLDGSHETVPFEDNENG